MKFSLTLTAIILGIGLMLGLSHQSQLTTLQEKGQQLAHQAGAAGLSSQATKRPPREEQAGRMRHIASEIADLTREMTQREEDETSDDTAYQQRSLDLMQRISALNAEQIQSVLDALRADSSLTAGNRQEMAEYCLTTLAETDPAAALSLFPKTKDLFPNPDDSQAFLSTAVEKLALADPSAALQWVRENAKTPPTKEDDALKNSLLVGTAARQPQQVFKLMSELGVMDTSVAIEEIMASATDASQRSALLGAFRNHLATVSDPAAKSALEDQAFSSLARNLSDQGYDSTTAWVSSQQLTTDEKEKFLDGLSLASHPAETGRWVDWIAQSLPAEKSTKYIKELIGQWTQDDYQAAGKWLATAPAGPAKTAAVSSYAEAVAAYEPQTAAQWADTLPEGEDRADTYRAIYRNWPDTDAATIAAAEAFAQKHLITPKQR